MIFWHTLADLLLPRRCAVCNAELCREETVLCNVCLCRLQDIPWTDIHDNPLLRSLWNRHEVEAAGSSFFYNHSSTLHSAFILLKYGHRPDIGRHMGRHAFPRWWHHGLGKGADYIVCVPLSHQRLWQRGYNQAEFIARGISDVTGIPLLPGVLKRMRNNPSQTRRTLRQRQENTRNLFAVTSRSPCLDGKTVLLVDDIFTTGSTLGDCIRALRQTFSAVRIHIYTLGYSGDM